MTIVDELQDVPLAEEVVTTAEAGNYDGPSDAVIIPADYEGPSDDVDLMNKTATTTTTMPNTTTTTVNKITYTIPAPTTTNSSTTTAVPMGIEANSEPQQNNIGKVRGVTIGIVVCDSIAILCWLLTWLLPPIGYLLLIALITGCVLGFVIPCLSKQGLDTRILSKCKSVWISHLITLCCWIISIVLFLCKLVCATMKLLHSYNPML